MQVDALTLAALADELHSGLLGARIDDVIQPTPSAVALQCFGGADGARNRWLLASAHPQFARLHLQTPKPRKLVLDPPAFVMLLRKYVEGARVVQVRQPRWERLIEIGFAHGAPAGTERIPEVWLVVEIMGQLSNLILRDAAGLILGSLRHIGPEMNRYRTITPNVEYRYPPPQTRTLDGAVVPRLVPEAVTAEDLRQAATAMATAVPLPAASEGATSPTMRSRKAVRKRAASGPTLSGLLTGHLAGFSRELAAEVLARAHTTSADQPTHDAPLDALTDPPLSTPDEVAAQPWGALAAAVRSIAELPDSHTWEPLLLYVGANGQAAALPTGFAVYRPQRYAPQQLRTQPGVNAMLAAYFEGAEWLNAVETAKHTLRHVLQTNRERCLRKLTALQGEMQTVEEAARLRQEADILLAFQHEVPLHSSAYTLENPFAVAEDASGAAGDVVTIALDPRLSAVENANKKYDRYHKLQRATNLIPPQIDATNLELARIEQLRTDLVLAETPPEIAQVHAEVAEAGYLRSAGGATGMRRGGKPQKSNKPGKIHKQQSKRGPEGGAPLRRQLADGVLLLIGKNSRQNETVTFREAGPTDMWLHARGIPGAHVIIKAGGRAVSDETLQRAAAIAAYYSQSRGDGSVEVDYTQQRYVRHMKGGGPGMVIYEREHTLNVAPADIEA